VNHNGELDAGDSVRFGFQVANVGGLSVYGLHIVDHRLARLHVAVSCPATQLSPGQTTVCTSDRMVITRYQSKHHLGRNFAYAAATTSGGTPVRSRATVITLVRSTAQLPNTGSEVGLGAVGAALLALLAGFALTGSGRRRPWKLAACRVRPVRARLTGIR
jgi:LPXTG-motif cell wall-anchored protein